MQISKKCKSPSKVQLVKKKYVRLFLWLRNISLKTYRVNMKCICLGVCIIPSWFTDIYCATMVYSTFSKHPLRCYRVYPGALWAKTLILGRDQACYLISAYSGTHTVEVHSATHADPAYRRSNAGQRLQHTLAYNPHKCKLVVWMCVWKRRRESKGESSRILPCVSTGVVWLFCDSHRQSTGNAPLVCGQSQLNFFRDKDRFFQKPDSPSLQRHHAFAEVWSVEQNTGNVVILMDRLIMASVYISIYFWCYSNNAWPLTHVLTKS